MKHFFKTLVLFVGMILLGLVGMFLVNHYGLKSTENSTGASVAK